MRKTKRWLAFLLSLSMVLSVGTSPVLAASADDPAQTAVKLLHRRARMQRQKSRQRLRRRRPEKKKPKQKKPKQKRERQKRQRARLQKLKLKRRRIRGLMQRQNLRNRKIRSHLLRQRKLTACYLVSRPMTRLVYPRILMRTERRLFTGRLPTPTSGRERESLLRQAA